jgi:hypothetical protein
MLSTDFLQPNEIIRLILLYCQTPRDYLSQSLVNRQWSSEARLLKLQMKTRFARQLIFLNHRSVIWNFHIRLTVIGRGEHLQRHGLEECLQIYHRVGGPGANVYYLERYWQEGKLHGLEIVREINEIWYQNFYRNNAEASDEIIDHPYNGLSAVDSMRKYGRHLLTPKNTTLPTICDFLGKIVFKYEWISGTLEDSQQLKRNLIHESDQSNVNGLYDFIHEFDVSRISMQELPEWHRFN